MNVTVFCGSAQGNHPAYLEAARETGRIIGQNGWQLVYGGASIGLMGAAADACLAAGGRVHGIIPGFMRGREIAHHGLTRLTYVASMHERKQRMASEADVFLALPGGFGTFEEILEIMTWKQLRLHSRPAGFLNVNGYYNTLLHFFEESRANGFIRQELNAYYDVWETPAAFETFARRHADALPPRQPDLFPLT